MTLAYALPKTGHPNCRRPDKVIDAGHIQHIALEMPCREPKVAISLRLKLV